MYPWPHDCPYASPRMAPMGTGGGCGSGDGDSDGDGMGQSCKCRWDGGDMGPPAPELLHYSNALKFGIVELSQVLSPLPQEQGSVLQEGDI